MTANSQSILDAALALAEKERAKIAERLLASLSPDEMLAELDRRLVEFKRDPSKAVTWSELKKKSWVAAAVLCSASHLVTDYDAGASRARFVAAPDSPLANRRCRGLCLGRHRCASCLGHDCLARTNNSELPKSHSWDDSARS